MSQTLNKEAIAEKLGLHDLFSEVGKGKTKEFVEDFFQMIADEVVAGNTVSIAGFGKFEPYKSTTTGKVTPKFRPFSKFKEALAN